MRYKYANCLRKFASLLSRVAAILFFIVSQFSGSMPDSNFVETKLLASETISLENRYGNSFVNGVYRDNILLTMAYMRGSVKTKEDIIENMKNTFPLITDVQKMNLISNHA